MLLSLISYYWPRLILGLWFAFTMLMILHRREPEKNHILDFVITFLVSCPVVAIVAEQIATRLFNSLLAPSLISLPDENYNAIYVAFCFITDAISYVIPLIIFSKIIKENMVTSTAIYFMYVVMDRLALILSVSALSYFFIVALILVASFFLYGDQMDFSSFDVSSVEWKPVLHYQLGLFFLFDALYGAYYIFPGIVNGILDFRNGWIDAIAIISFIFFAGFARMNLKVTKAQNDKMYFLQKLEQSEQDIIQKFSEISEAKSGETGQHIKRVAEYSAVLAQEYGLSENDVNHIRIASMMHDVGKLLVPREIIEKPGSLTREEMTIMKQHPNYGYEILSNSEGEVIDMARTIAHQHHERWDGKGYPNGLSNNNISVYAQIVAVADVYDALTGRRSYKEAWDSKTARAEIISQRGRQFAPKVVDAFTKCYDKIVEIQNKYAD